ncbi:MAG: DUF4835 family protein [Bacteroidales bacterium]|nr:DUF4835 family protein [Bacteroidales bacterium]
MLKKLIIFTGILIFAIQAKSQELYCNVQINHQQVEGTDKKVFETLRTAIYEFMNNRQWTNYNFEITERIECSILLNITNRVSTDEFTAELNMALKRPVYNSAYNSTLLNYVDKNFRFTYVEYQPLEFAENTYYSNLTSVLAFYAYMFIGLDFDSFTLYGGTPFFEKAENVVSVAQSSGETGWKSFDSEKNRFWMVENIMNPSYQPVRRFFYEYHRLGLDVMYDDSQKGRAAIIKSIEHLTRVKDNYPNLFILQLIMDAKGDEMVNVFSEGSTTEKARGSNMLIKLDPSNASKYEEIMK